MKSKILIAALLVATVSSSCKKEFLDTFSTTAVAASDALASIGNARAALNGIHRLMYVQYDAQPQGGYGGIMIIRDLMGEDVIYTNPGGRGDFIGHIRWQDHRNVNSGNSRYVYRLYYQLISNANVLINGIDGVPGATQTERNHIKGQALVYRAWAHFELVQYFGERFAAGGANSGLGVPLLLTPNNTTPLARATVAEVYAQVNRDLNEAIALLAGYVRTGSAAKSNFNTNVAQGIKARVALTQGNWDSAAVFAAQARTGFPLMTNAEYLSGFNNTAIGEWMWGSDQIADHNTFFWSFFASMGCNFNGSNTRTQPKAINSVLFNALPTTDVRRACFDATGATVPIPPGGIRINFQSKKFLAFDAATSIGDVPYMRSGEMFLIEAEARARQGRDVDARQALFTLLRNRNPNYVLSTNSGTALIEEIMLNRRAELWGEGFRWFDLKRLNAPLDRSAIAAPNTNAAISLTLSVPAGDKQWQWLFHQDETNNNPNLVQNPL
jgi:starch-binding outer membrane protein, SusD/RagB family